MKLLTFVSLLVFSCAYPGDSEDYDWIYKVPRRPINLEQLLKRTPSSSTAQNYVGQPKAVANCGISATSSDGDSKLYGGQDAVPHEFPWQVAIYINNPDGTFFGGGTLISQDWVLTAGHCTIGADSITVVMGAQNINQAESTQVRMTAPSSNIITHPGFIPSVGLQNDIGLIRLPSPAPYTNEIRPVCLPTYHDYIGGGVGLTVSGWGGMIGGNLADTLQKLPMSSLTDSDCSQVLSNIDGSVLCADSTTGTGTCGGDSGGPLTYVSGGITYHEGVVSFGVGGCGSSYPDGFTRTTYYLDWISAQTGIAIDP